MNLAYDRLADVYDQWITGDPACESCLDFYLRRLADTVGRIVDGGVGTGRLAVELARRGRAVLGIDESLPMLERARHRARQLPGDASLGLCQMDLLSLGLRGVDVFVLPFRTIGHFVTLDARKRLLRQVFESLEPGGRFIFDHYVPDLEWAQVHGSLYGTSRRAIEDRLAKEGVRPGSWQISRFKGLGEMSSAQLWEDRKSVV